MQRQFKTYFSDKFLGMCELPEMARGGIPTASNSRAPSLIMSKAQAMRKCLLHKNGYEVSFEGDSYTVEPYMPEEMVALSEIHCEAVNCVSFMKSFAANRGIMRFPTHHCARCVCTIEDYEFFLTASMRREYPWLPDKVEVLNCALELLSDELPSILPMILFCGVLHMTHEDIRDAGYVMVHRSGVDDPTSCGHYYTLINVHNPDVPLFVKDKWYEFVSGSDHRFLVGVELNPGPSFVMATLCSFYVVCPLYEIRDTCEPTLNDYFLGLVSTVVYFAVVVVCFERVVMALLFRRQDLARAVSHFVFSTYIAAKVWYGLNLWFCIPEQTKELSVYVAQMSDHVPPKRANKESDVQEAIERIENLSLLNRSNFRKPKNVKFADQITRELVTAKRCLRKKMKKQKKNVVLGCSLSDEVCDSSGAAFKAQMFDAFVPSMKVRIDDEQFARIQDAVKAFGNAFEQLGISDGSGDGIRRLSFVAGVTAGQGAAEGAIVGVVEILKNSFSAIVAKYGPLVLNVVIVSVLTREWLREGSISNRSALLGVVGLVLTLMDWKELGKSLIGLAEHIAARANRDQEPHVELEECDFQAQMFDVTTATDIVVLLLTWTTFPKMRGSVADIAKFIGNVGKGYTGVEAVVSLVLRVFQKILDFASTKIGFESFSVLSSMIPKADAWMTDARTLLSGYASGKKVHDQETFDKFLTLEDRAYELLSLYSGDRRAIGVSQLVRPLLNEIIKVRTLLQQEGAFQYKMRQAPLMISLAGASQIGKSRMLRPFVARLLAMVLDKDELEQVRKDFDSHVYSRQPEHEFWDGYCGQTVCFLDEKDLVKETLLTANNANTDIIRMGNVFPNVLHMAGIEQKGNVHFRSKIVVCTTNVLRSDLGAQGAVRYPEAVVNRFHFEVIVRVRREYAIEEDLKLHPGLWRLDRSKLPSDGSFDYNVHEYVILERVKNTEAPHEVRLVEGDIVNFEELLVRCARKYRALVHEASTIPLDDVRAFDHGLELRERVNGSSPSGAVAQMDDVKPDCDRRVMLDWFWQTLYSDANAKTIGRRLASVPRLEVTSCFRPLYEACVHKAGLAEQDVHLVMDMLCSRFDLCDLTELADRMASFPEGMLSYVREAKAFEQGMEEHRTILSDACRRSLFVLNRMSRGLEQVWERLKVHFSELTGLCDFEFVQKIYAVPVFLFVAATALLARCFWPGKVGEEKKHGDVAVAQMHDPALEDVSRKVWKSNYYSIHFAGDDRSIGFGFFSHGTTFNMCSHYVNTWKERNYGDEAFELRGVEGYVIPMKGHQFFDFEQKGVDWIAGEIPHSRRHADIRGLMGDTSLLKNRSRGDIMMIRKRGGTVEKVFSQFSVTYTCHYSDPVGKVYRVPVGLKYAIPTVDGECGLPLFIVDPTCRSRKFIGFHVAGTRNAGMCFVFPEASSDDHAVAQLKYVPRTMVEIGSVDRSVGSSGLSSIRPSPLHGAWGPPSKDVARLRSFVNEEGERVYPMERAIMRYDQPILVYDQQLVDACTHAAVAANTDSIHFATSPKRVSLEEAVLGIPGSEFMESINRSTSPGYPWNMSPLAGYKGKERFFGKGVDITFDGPDWPELKKQIDEAHAMYLRGERPLFYFADALKDELLKHSKVESGDTRLFCPSPIVYQVIFGMYFKDFLKKFMQSRIICEHAVGINVYSDEWDVLCRKLSVHGANSIVAGDFKSFDALEAAQVLRAIGECVIEVFGDRQYDEVRRLLWMEVWNSRHIVGKTIYEWRQSLPSGHPATTVINCLFVCTVMRMCWVKANGGEITSLRSFGDNVALVAYGDDNVLGISSNAMSIFNQHEITKHMASLGLIYTPENKEDEVGEFRHISEVEFLKRAWRYEPRVGRHVAPLRLSSILEMPYWSKKEFYEDIWRTNVDTALKELSLHPPHVFEEWAPRIVEASRRCGYTPLVIDRNTLLDEVCSSVNLYGPRR